MKTSFIAALLASCLCVAPTLAGAKIKVGFITTTSGPSGIVGKHMKDGADLALENLGGKLGGVDAEIIYGDAQYKPDVGRQLAEQMLKQDKVDFVTGVILSSTLLAVYQPVIKSGNILVSANAGPSQIAGKMCAPNFFTTSWQNDQTPEAMGKYMNDKKITDVYVMAPNYAAGKDMVAGFKRYFKGRIINEVYTTFGQADYQAELSQLKAAKPKAVFVFYSGGMGIQFFKQYAQAGLRDIPLYSVFGADETTLPAIGDAAVGNYEAGFWNYDLDFPANRKFVDAFRKKYGYIPSYYAAQSYDAINLINSAVKAVHGNVKDKKGMIAAMEKADFDSVRGPFHYNTNHFPIQNFYLFQVVKDEQGNLVRKTIATVFQAHKDHYYDQCAMK
ncbi:MAG TPA: ABC transporter substrate-binding protein [Eoetvoesiella sp.]|uniref:ABC transporter substrate-binding protein n=1 Tax=Eoetvoesiella sp. TaxID=1966355 RepID=UPI002D0B1B6A|nr:ABC transporter substrate-binding protein [Eoetvoesiella sp.]HWK60577.1 ABC transporter substrate-binding protein [Eoetvoesiella sp.]